MRRFAVLALAFLAIPSVAFAACDGEDLRDTLPPEMMRQIRAGISDVPFREGIAFEAVRGDTRLTLFGTVHIYDPAVFIPAEIAARARTADLVLLEVTLTAAIQSPSWTANESLLVDPDGPGLRTRLTAEEWQRLAAFFTILCLHGRRRSTKYLRGQRPWLSFGRHATNLTCCSAPRSSTNSSSSSLTPPASRSARWMTMSSRLLPFL